MELYLLRHAIAVNRGGRKYESDSERPLTDEGRKKLKRCIRGIKNLELNFDFILSSPYLRAKATAEMVAQSLQLRRRLEFSKHLAPDGDAESLFDQIKRSHGSVRRLLLVGHEPCLSQLAGTLIGGPIRVGLRMRKAGLCKLTVEHLRFGHCAVLDWLLTPRQLAMIG
jgi:phosphohistidine phosphatase